MGICPYCKHKWISRVSDPQACPRCKRRLDYVPKKIKGRFDKLEKTTKTS